MATQLDILNLKNEKVGSLEVPEALAALEYRPALIHQVVKAYLANQRQGTAKTKTRGDVSGAGKKLWKQKGTGRARVGSIRTPLWRHGGTTQGPKPRDCREDLPRSMRRAALASVVAERIRRGDLILVDSLKMETTKTKALATALKAIGAVRGGLLVDSDTARETRLAGRNIPGVEMSRVADLHTAAAAGARKLVMTEAAFRAFAQGVTE